jgi:hypothetical protein
MAQLDRATVCGTVGRRFESSWAHHISGEVAERSKAVDSKSAVPYGYRGFESHPLLQRNAGPNFAECYRLEIFTGRNSRFKVSSGGSPSPPYKGGRGDSSLAPHSKFIKRRGGRVVEGARLESVCRFTPTEGSNPSLSATPSQEGERVDG